MDSLSICSSIFILFALVDEDFSEIMTAETFFLKL